MRSAARKRKSLICAMSLTRRRQASSSSNSAALCVFRPPSRWIRARLWNPEDRANGVDDTVSLPGSALPAGETERSGSPSRTSSTLWSNYVKPRSHAYAEQAVLRLRGHRGAEEGGEPVQPEGQRFEASLKIIDH